MTNNKIKVMLVDDHAVVRAGFKLLLTTGSNIEVIAEAERGELAIQLYQKYQPDMVILDLSMPGIGGLETIKRIMQRDANAKILVFSVHNEQVYVNRALNAGAKGYITKNSAPGILAEAIECIQTANYYVEKGLLKETNNQSSEYDYQTILQSFSAREFDIFSLLAKGHTAHKIADELCLSYKTVANYATQIKKKMHVSSNTELAHVAIMLGVTKQIK